MRKITIYLLLLFSIHQTLNAQVTVSGSTGADGTYTSLTLATGAFAKINAGNQTGKNIVIKITGNCTAETGATQLGAGLWTSLIIYPTVAGLSVKGTAYNPIIGLNGSDKVTVDGRVNATGSTASLSIINLSTSVTATTIRFVNSAQNNTVKYCNLKGSGARSTVGIIVFSTSLSGTGNDGNTITYNNISGNGTSRPFNAIRSSGTAGADNSGNIISNNNFYNYFNAANESYGINIIAESSSWTISGNSFYETSSFIPDADVSFYSISIKAGNNYTISGNYIGGNATLCGGTAFTKTNARNNDFYAMYLNFTTGTASSIQNNTIKNFSWSNTTAADWFGIVIAGGNVNAGTITGNTIGGNTGTGSITLNGTANDSIIAVYITSPGTVNCNNNKIGSITAANSSASSSQVVAIYKDAIAGTTTINQNIIGSTVTANSINSSSSSTANVQNVRGILNEGTGSVTISGNTIANLKNSTTNGNKAAAGTINGIASFNGTCLISGNTVYNLTNANANNNKLLSASVCGIALSGTTQKTITGNTIYGLSNTFASFTGSVTGIFFTGSASNNISGNFIYSLSVNSGSATADVFGIRISSGTSTYYNNIITLGGTTLTNITGIYESGAAGNNNSLYHNTVYISGSPASGSNKSYCLYGAVNTNTRNYRNNIFFNARSTTGGSNLHYALYAATAGGTITCDYNDYYVTGAGGILGRYGATNIAVLPIVPGQDLNSCAIDPVFTSPGGTTAISYKIGVDLIGVTGTGITTDYGSAPRNTPSMGAWEKILNKWKGTVSTAWNTPANWTANTVPFSNANIYFDDAPLRNCYLDQDRSISNLKINQGTYSLVTNGFKLTIKGSLIFTNGGKIDASSANSTVEMAGTAAQSIPAGAFMNNQVYNLIINNSGNVTFSGTINILNTVAATSGRLDAITNNPTIVYGSSEAQSIENNLFLNNSVYNLTSDNSGGVSLNTDLTVTGTLRINSTKKFIIRPANTLTAFIIVNNAGNSGFIIKSDATGDARLINNTPSVPATVFLYLSGGLISPEVGVFHYFVPPVQTMTICVNPDIDEVATSLGLTYFNGDLMQFTESLAVNSNDEGWQYFDDYPNNPQLIIPSLLSSRGYNIHFGSADFMRFSGQLNSAEHNFNLTYTSGNSDPGWNLIGNPYPCNFDLSGVDGLGTVLDGISNTVYYNNNGAYTYYNVLTKTGSAGYTDIVPPMTGFFVTVEKPMSITLPLTSKTTSPSDSRSVHKGGSGFDENKGSALRKVRLQLSNDVKTDETIVLLMDNAKSSFNEHYDAFKLYDTIYTNPNISSSIGNVDYFMKAVAPPVSDPVVIPLKVVIKEAGTHNINITEFENLENLSVYLEHGLNLIKLNRDATYSFKSPAGTFNDFKLIFGNNNVITGNEKLPEGKLTTWYSNRFIYINSPSSISSDHAELTVFDMQGRPVYINTQVFLIPGETINLPVSIPGGFYMMHLNAGNMIFTSKIIVL